MAKAFQCDICGEFYKPYSFHANQDISKPNSISFANRNDFQDGFKHLWIYDACPECMKAVEEFVENRKPKKGDS